MNSFVNRSRSHVFNSTFRQLFQFSSIRGEFSLPVQQRSFTSYSALSTKPAFHAAPVRNHSFVNSMTRFFASNRVYEGEVVNDGYSRASEEEDSSSSSGPFSKLGLTIAATGALIGIGVLSYAGSGDISSTTDGADSAALANSKIYPSFVRERMAATYAYVGSGCVVAAVSATLAFRSGLAVRMLSMNPWLVMGAGLVGSIGALVLTHSIDYQRNPAGKAAAFALFSTATGLSLCTLGFVGPTILWNAATATGIMVGSISLLASNAPSDTFLWMRGPLVVGLGVVVCASFGTMFFPASTLLMNVSLYGGVGVFGAFQLYDVSRVTQIAKTSVEFDPVDNATKIFLNIINIYVRMVQIFAQASGNKKK